MGYPVPGAAVPPAWNRLHLRKYEGQQKMLFVQYFIVRRRPEAIDAWAAVSFQAKVATISFALEQGR